MVVASSEPALSPANECFMTVVGWGVGRMGNWDRVEVGVGWGTKGVVYHN